MKNDVSKWLLAGILFIPAASDARYLDPGSGSLIIQLLIAGAAAISYFFRHSIGSFFKKLRGGQTEEDDDNDE
ncbi:MAG: hypothetical protein KF821_02720 [Anaerolineales bacterium]|jgi:hypothetical protein|nr:hypothetical protein [Anaerolineales bacterium]MBX3004723.1 hypothetical protein [Anaerolineales bacterium]MCW5838416.1 hypothetical protein [Anaerolineales bacterium]MCW5886961.1 hypothetical protein [Anaerolineales bacterium]